MAWRLLKGGALKEFKVKVDDDFRVSGYMKLVGKGRATLNGFPTHLNYVNLKKESKRLEELKKKLPIILHFRNKYPLPEDYIIPEPYADAGKSIKEYLERIKKELTIEDWFEITLKKDLHVVFCTKENSEFKLRFDLSKIDIIERQNI